MANKGLNIVILAGNVCADPELRTTQGGQSILNLRLATNDSYKDRDGAWQDTVEYHNVALWGPRADALSKFVVKGSSLTVHGKLKTSSWEKDGIKRFKTEIIANEIVLPKRSEGGGEGGHDGGEQRQQGGGYARGNGGGQRSQGRQQAPAQAPPADDGDDFDAGGFGGDSDIPF